MFLSSSPDLRSGDDHHVTEECHHGLQWLHARSRWLWGEGLEWVFLGGSERETEKNNRYTLLKLAANTPCKLMGGSDDSFPIGFFLRPIFLGAFSLLLVSGRVNHRGGWVTLFFFLIQNVQITEVQLSWVSWLGLLDPFFFMIFFGGTLPCSEEHVYIFQLNLWYVLEFWLFWSTWMSMEVRD